MADKTEAPTPRRLSEAREEGNISRSQEIITAAVLLSSVYLLQGPGSSLVQALKELLVDGLVYFPKMMMTEGNFRQIIFTTGYRIIPSLAMILIGLAAIVIFVNGLQTGFLWSSKRLQFDPKRLNPLSGLKRIFSKHGLINLVKGLLKLSVVGWVAYSFLRGNVESILLLGQVDFIAGMNRWSQLAISMCLQVAGVYLVLAIGDYAFERWQYMRQLRMTKEEVKEEYKRMEGDPILKGRIRSEQRRIARMRMMANVPKSTVVITNPTHLAIALEYNETLSAPRVVAKGAHLIAGRIVELARENQIPVVQNVPLARALYKTVEIDQFIPEELYLAVAEILAYIFNLKKPASLPAHIQVS